MALDPNREIEEFLARTSTSHERHLRVVEAIDDAPDRASLRKGLAVDAMFRLGVEWELLQHRWHVAAISRDPSKVIAREIEHIAAVQGKVRKNSARVFDVSINHRKPTRLKQSEIEQLVDPQDRNLGFADMQAWRRVATKDLASIYVERVCRLADDPKSASFLDLVKSMRDYIAHGSRDASRRLNRMVAPRIDGEAGLVGSINEPLARAQNGIRDLGTYLNDLGYPATNRLDLIHLRVQGLAEKLRTD